MKHIWLLPVCMALGGCMTAAQHSQQLASTRDRALTVGMVQRDIKVGISAVDVATALGSPNIVTGDNENHETWIYDKVATEASFSQDAGSVGASVEGTGQFGGFPLGGSGNSGAVSVTSPNSYSKTAGAASLTQRTLTVIIKFSSSNTVESVSYNSTRF